MASKRRKKTSKKISQAKPSPQQLKALKRLQDKGEIYQAISRVEALIKQYPKFSVLYLQGIELYVDSNYPARAIWCALRWTQTSPNSLQAWSSLYDLSIEGGYLALMLEASKQFNRLAEQHKEEPIISPPLEEISQQLLELKPDNTQISTREDALIIDTGKLLLDAHQWKASLPYMADTLYYPASANNYALALFQMGEVDTALNAYEDAFIREPENLFALSGYIRLLVWNDEKEKAVSYANKLKDIKPTRPLYADAQLAGLAFLEMYDEAFECCQKWSNEEIATLDDGFFHLAASIAFRLGKNELAEDFWNKAPFKNYRGAEENPTSLLQLSGEKKRNPALFASSELLPMTWVESFSTFSSRFSKDEEIYSAIKREFIPAPSLEYLRLSYEVSDAFSLAIFELILMSGGEKEEKKLLLKLLRSHRTDVAHKTELIHRLQRMEIINSDDEINYWDGENIQTMHPYQFTVIRGAVVGTLSEEDHDYYDDTLEIMKQGNIMEAHTRLLWLTKHYPEDPTIKGNIASCRMAEDKEQGISEYQKILTEFPDYLFARCMLAEIRIDDGQLDEAKDLMKDIMKRKEQVHIHDLILIYGVNAYLTASEGNEDGANSYLNMIKQIVEYPDEKKKLEIWQNKVDTQLYPENR